MHKQKSINLQKPKKEDFLSEIQKNILDSSSKISKLQH